jgi:hypothetical protein
MEHNIFLEIFRIVAQYILAPMAKEWVSSRLKKHSTTKKNRSRKSLR